MKLDRCVPNPAWTQIDAAGSTISFALSSRPRSLISWRNQVSANATNTIGTADTNTVLSAETNEEITGPRTACGSAAITCGEPVSCEGLTPCSGDAGHPSASPGGG